MTRIQHPEDWDVFTLSLYDDWNGRARRVPGVCLHEWLSYVHHDYDCVDRLYIDAETIGGG